MGRKGDRASVFCDSAYPEKKPHSIEMCGTSEMRLRVKPDKKTELMISVVREPSP